jgi:hypothetical protein
MCSDTEHTAQFGLDSPSEREARGHHSRARADPDRPNVVGVDRPNVVGVDRLDAALKAPMADRQAKPQGES